MEHQEAAGGGAQATPKKMAITHVIFDTDGLLLDTKKFYSVAQDQILARFEKTYDWNLKVKMMGTIPIESARIFVNETGIAHELTPEDFLCEREQILTKLLPDCEMMPGAPRQVKYLHSNGMPICVATSSSKLHFELKTHNQRELFSLMSHIAMCDDAEVKRGKHSMDLFLTAAKRFKGRPVHPCSVLVFEDALNGVLAAKNPGMFVVIVINPNLDNLYLGKADQVLKSLRDFNHRDWGCCQNLSRPTTRVCQQELQDLRLSVGVEGRWWLCS